MAILVTGAAGFLGSYVASALAAAGKPVRGFDIAAPGAEALAVAPVLAEGFVQGQITDADRVRDVVRVNAVEAIVHTAAMVGLELSLQQPLASYQTNAIGFANVCEAARLAGTKRIVLVSSNAVYHGARGAMLDETDPVFSVDRGNPAGHYGTSKMMQEAIALAYATFHGLDVFILRVTAIYGFGMRAPLYIKPMVENAVDGRPTRFATGGAMKRDYTYVLDCVRAIVGALDAPTGVSPPRILNVSAGKLLSASEVAAAVRRVLAGADISIGEALTPLEAENVKMRAPLNVEAAKACLGWTPQWSIDDGISDYADRYRRFRAML
jgi:UDP-glucose 4-epimerase